ncbi:DUF4153 domain-containing protein [Thermobrachium celere]|uniref:DUF4153 domain-containing protein n=1 Tax=Thermobrachium celere TaxID=53422 RepID=UPI001943A880|nr:DUF4153 domain-containing protein [Thermobrachium celere]GFR36617.1 DUF4153 domain-containing protein [Thermobrachium celere]
MNISNFTFKITKAFENSIKRFPVAFLFSLAACITMISIVEYRTSPPSTLQRLAMILILSIPVTLTAKMIWERRQEDYARLLIYYAVSFVFIIGYYFIYLNKLDYISTSRIVGSNIIFYLLFLLIPYFIDRKNFEMYSIKIFTAGFITSIYTGVLYFGLSAILFTIDRLLEVKINPETYLQTFFICVFIFAVNYFLSLVPRIKDNFTKDVFPRAFNILLNYIVVPLLTAYTIILYIYFFKILITQNWPKGLVSHLVLWYSFITILVVFFLAPIKEDVKIAYYFTKVITKAIIPLILMMFTSMGIRINAYGVTEPRYYVIIAGIWVLLVFLYWNITKEAKNALIPFTLAITIFISLFTPLSSFSISRYSQNKRFESILKRNNMLKDGKIIKNPNIDKKDKQQISSIISYFEYRQGIDKLKFVPSDFNSSKMKEVFGFEYEALYTPDNIQYFYYRIKQNSLIDIKGYDYFVQINSYNIDTTNMKEFSFKYNNSNATLYIYKNNVLIYSKNINEILKGIYEKYNMLQKDTELDVDALTYVDENQNIKIKIILNNISGRKGEDQTPTIDGCEFIIMFSIK